MFCTVFLYAYGVCLTVYISGYSRVYFPLNQWDKYELIIIRSDFLVNTNFSKILDTPFFKNS